MLPAAASFRARLLPRNTRMCMRRTLQTHASYRTDGIEAECHAAAVDRVGFVHQLGQQFREAARVLQPLCRLVQKIVRGLLRVHSVLQR